MEKRKGFKTSDLRDLIRFATVIFLVPWFSWLTVNLFGAEIEFESEIAVVFCFLIFGSFWCGWLCPFGNLSYFVSKLGKNLFPSLQFNISPKWDEKLRYLKYLFLLIFLYVLISGSVNYFLDDHMVMYKSTDVTSWYITLKKYFIILVPLIIPRFFCKYICFQKGLYNLMNRIFPTMVIKRDSEKCISCSLCDKKCPMTIDVSSCDKISGKDCISCYDCVDSCPSKVQALSIRWFGIKVDPKWFSLLIIVVYYCITFIIFRLLH